MSGAGSPKLTGIDAAGAKVAIIAASWHTEVMDGLIAGAEATLAEVGIDNAKLVRVPGSFELPVVAQAYAKAGYDVVIALGVIIRGGTPHFEYVAASATDGLTRVALDTGVPVGFGLLTCDNDEQALERAGLAGSKEDKGREATEAALATWLLLRDVL
ncbi:MAG: 6,7-dimethyl-8-ribityllumazine synthase [Propionibacteriales bacterium]|nr:6,7-dimethyl-8-ribityllumazine synthase [Propionibacteriales bacterium]